MLNEHSLNQNKVGGWLLFFCLTLTVFSPSISVSNFYASKEEIAASFPYYPLAQPFMTLMTYVVLVMAACSISCGILLFKRSSIAVRVTKIFLIASIIVSACEGIGTYYVYTHPISQYLPMINEAYTSQMTITLLMGFISPLGYSLIWIMYLNRSKRVATTFSLSDPWVNDDFINVDSEKNT